MFVKYSHKATPTLNSAVHRLFWNCPLCGFQVDSEKEYEVWLAETNLHEVIMRDYKVDCIIAVSECPGCHKLSYTHYDLNTVIRACQIGRIKLNLKELRLERARRRWIINGIWATNKCKTCIYLKKLQRRRYSITADCEDKGWSRTGPPPNQCEHYHFGKPQKQAFEN